MYFFTKVSSQLWDKVFSKTLPLQYNIKPCTGVQLVKSRAFAILSRDQWVEGTVLWYLRYSFKMKIKAQVNPYHLHSIKQWFIISIAWNTALHTSCIPSHWAMKACRRHVNHPAHTCCTDEKFNHYIVKSCWYGNSMLLGYVFSEN